MRLVKKGNLHEWSKMLSLAFIVGISSEVRITAITSGFIIAMSVLMMSLFLYCFEERTPARFILCCAVISPLVRLINEFYMWHDFKRSLLEVVPDAGFFVVYALVYSLLYRTVFLESKTVRNFPIMIFFADAIGNSAELLLRSVLYRIFPYSHYAGEYFCHRAIFQYLASTRNGRGIQAPCGTNLKT